MNDQIKILAKQAECPIDFFGYGEGNVERFAELMVQKFDDILVLEYLDCVGNKDKLAAERVERLREKVKTYFGVEV